MEAMPWSQEDFDLVLKDNPEVVTSPKDHRYGKYRQVERKDTLDMSHVKRIRGCPHDKEMVDVVITMKSKWI
jgi:hypothetical protein